VELVLSQTTLDRIPDDTDPFPMCEPCWSRAITLLPAPEEVAKMNDKQMEKLKEALGEDCEPEVRALEKQIEEIVEKYAGTERPQDN
jgi:hypothetical protein